MAARAHEALREARGPEGPRSAGPHGQEGRCGIPPPPFTARLGEVDAVPNHDPTTAIDAMPNGPVGHPRREALLTGDEPPLLLDDLAQ